MPKPNKPVDEVEAAVNRLLAKIENVYQGWVAIGKQLDRIEADVAALKKRSA